MDAVKFLEELKRMCAAYQGCEGCPLHIPEDRWRCKLSLSPVSWKTPIETICDTVEKWSAEHPKKTRLQDFMEKHPNALVDKNGVPYMRPATLGYCDVKECEWCKQYYVSSYICWTKPLEE